MATNDPALKRMLPFLKRADEIQKVDPLTAYYCRLYALELGMTFAASERSSEANGMLYAIMSKLEKDKKTMTLSADDQMHIEGVAVNIFNKADRQDRAGRADRGTAQAYYAAACFLDVCRHFEEDLTPELTEKQKYATWRAGEINKAIREGRTPTPPPADDDTLDPDLAEFAPSTSSAGPSNPAQGTDSIQTDEFGLPVVPGSTVNPQYGREPTLSRTSSFPDPPTPPTQVDMSPPPSHPSPPGYTVITTVTNPSDPTQTPPFGHSSSFSAIPIAPGPGASSSAIPPPQYTQPKPPVSGMTPPGGPMYPGGPTPSGMPPHGGPTYPGGPTPSGMPPHGGPMYPGGPTPSGMPPHGGPMYPGGVEPTAPMYPSQHPGPVGHQQGLYPATHGSGSMRGGGGGGGGGVGGGPPLASAGSGGMYGYGGGGAPPPPPPAGFVPSPDKVAEAHKAAKAAVSALGFSDVTTGVEYLQHALNLLTRP